MRQPGEAAATAEAPAGGDTWDRRRVWVVVALYLLVTGWLSLELNVWRDEMYSLHTSSGSIGHAARQAIEFELQPPVYFATLSAWRTASDSVFFARLLSALFGAGAILTFAALARRLVPRVDPAYAAALLATHPFLVWAGTEVRVYALVVLLSAVLTLAFFEAYWRPGGSRARLLYAGVALVSVYTQYYLGVLFLCFGVALLVRRDRQRLVAFVTDMAGVAALSLPLAFALRAQLGSHRQDFGKPLSFGADVLRLVLGRFETYVFSFNQAIDQGSWSLGAIRIARWAYRALILAVAALGFVHLRALARRRAEGPGSTRPGIGDAWPLVVVVGTYAVCLVGLFVGMGPMSVGERHTAGLLVPALLAATAVPAFALGRGATYVWASLLVVSNVTASVLTQVLPMAKDCDCRRVAQAITERESSGEPIVVFPSEDAMPLSLYYRGKNTLLPVPRAPSYQSWDQSTFVIQSQDDVSRVLERDAPGSAALWVHTNKYGKSWGHDKLEAFLDTNYRQDERREFAHGVVLRHFVRRGAATSVGASP